MLGLGLVPIFVFHIVLLGKRWVLGLGSSSSQGPILPREGRGGCGGLCLILLKLHLVLVREGVVAKLEYHPPSKDLSCPAGGVVGCWARALSSFQDLTVPR